MGSLGEGRDPERPVRDQALTTVDADGPANGQIAPRVPLTIQVGGVLLAREQRRLAAILTADVVGYSHAAYEQIYYSSLMPRTYFCARLLETLD